MTKLRCEIAWHSVPDGPHAAGPWRAVAQCKTHNWWDVSAATQHLPHGTALCPIGRIEEATEAALAKIAAASGKQDDRP